MADLILRLPPRPRLTGPRNASTPEQRSRAWNKRLNRAARVSHEHHVLSHPWRYTTADPM